MTPLIFGSKEANDQLAHDMGIRYDLGGGADPFVPQPRMDYPDNDHLDSYCTICGGYMDWVDCWQCGGTGGRDGDDLMQEDPFWYTLDDWEECDICQGKGGYRECASIPHEDDANKEHPVL